MLLHVMAVRQVQSAGAVYLTDGIIRTLPVEMKGSAIICFVLNRQCKSKRMRLVGGILRAER
jgi:hypothetical protein